MYAPVLPIVFGQGLTNLLIFEVIDNEIYTLDVELSLSMLRKINTQPNSNSIIT